MSQDINKPAELFGGPFDGQVIQVTHLLSELGVPVEPSLLIVPSISAQEYWCTVKVEWSRIFYHNYYERFEPGKFCFKERRVDYPKQAKTRIRPLKAEWVGE